MNSCAMARTSVLAETPEIYGAEHLLTRRAVRPATSATNSIRLIRWWEDHAQLYNGSIDNNPSSETRKAG